MISLLVTLVLLVVLVYLAVVVIDLLIPTQPLNQVLKIVVGVILLLVFLQQSGLLGKVGF